MRSSWGCMSVVVVVVDLVGLVLGVAARFAVVLARYVFWTFVVFLGIAGGVISASLRFTATAMLVDGLAGCCCMRVVGVW